MKTDKNSWKGFFFFLLRLICLVATIVGLFFAYEFYRSKVVNSNLEMVYESLIELQNSLNK